jgi:hypothetical protein
MLKFTYTENGFYVEQFVQSLEDWVSQRVLLALRSGTPLAVEPSTATFLMPSDLPVITELEKLALGDSQEVLEVTQCDQGCVEVCLEGTWVGASSNAEEGWFACLMSDRTEKLLYQLWKDTQMTFAVSPD